MLGWGECGGFFFEDSAEVGDFGLALAAQSDPGLHFLEALEVSFLHCAELADLFVQAVDLLGALFEEVFVRGEILRE